MRQEKDGGVLCRVATWVDYTCNEKHSLFRKPSDASLFADLDRLIPKKRKTMQRLNNNNRGPRRMCDLCEMSEKTNFFKWDRSSIKTAVKVALFILSVFVFMFIWYFRRTLCLHFKCSSCPWLVSCHAVPISVLMNGWGFPRPSTDGVPGSARLAKEADILSVAGSNINKSKRNTLCVLLVPSPHFRVFVLSLAFVSWFGSCPVIGRFRFKVQPCSGVCRFLYA